MFLYGIFRLWQLGQLTPHIDWKDHRNGREVGRKHLPTSSRSRQSPKTGCRGCCLAEFWLSPNMAPLANWFQSAVNHNCFPPLDLSGIPCILIFAHCLLCLFLVITGKSLTTFLPPLSYSPVCQCLSCMGEPRPGEIPGDVSHQCWVKGKSHLPRPAAKTPPNAARVIVGLLRCKDTLLADIQLGVQQNPKVLFCKVSFQPVSPQYSWCMVLSISRCRTLLLPL